MNRIENRLNQNINQQEKSFVTYITAGLPDLETTKSLLKAQEEAGIDVIELGIPFSDPIADGPVIQEASFEAIKNGVTLKKIFQMMKGLREEGLSVAIVFMMYYNTVIHYGIKEFVKKCHEVGVDGLIIPDLPFEEQDELQQELGNSDETILIQLVSPISKERIPMILEHARGFVYCVSSMGVTGQSADFHKEVMDYLKTVKKHSKIPVMMGFGIREAKDVAPMKEIIDGAIVGSHFIKLMKSHNYDPAVAMDYVKTFKQELNS
ncbi:MAG: tryptophan synthase subunit alpha [Lachnospiraceae bacterium]|nr:tryptophan synthase subunit alpha [Lachnospiraceae bacterium]